MHKAISEEISETVYDAFQVCEEFNFLSKLEGTDMVAIDAVYHHKCLTSMKNRSRSIKLKTIKR